MIGAEKNKKSEKNLHPRSPCAIFVRNSEIRNTNIMKNSYNYQILNGLHLLIGGGNLTELPSLGLDIWRSSVCTKHAGDRLPCVLACPLGEVVDGDK